MTERFHVHVNVDDLEPAGAGVLSCTVFLQVGETFFPERGWIDLVSQLLPPWVDQIVNVIERQIESTECHFMDGPYSFIVSAEEGMLQVELLTPVRGDRSIHSVMPRDIVEGLLAAAEAIYEAIVKRRLETSDAQALREAIERLHKLRGLPILH